MPLDKKHLCENKEEQKNTNIFRWLEISRKSTNIFSFLLNVWYSKELSTYTALSSIQLHVCAAYNIYLQAYPGFM